MTKLPPGDYTVKEMRVDKDNNIIAEVVTGLYQGTIVYMEGTSINMIVPEGTQIRTVSGEKPWQWETVKDTGAITCHTLKGPDVLCRYWNDNEPSFNARLIEKAKELHKAASDLYDASVDSKPISEQMFYLNKVLMEIE